MITKLRRPTMSWPWLLLLALALSLSETGGAQAAPPLSDKAAAIVAQVSGRLSQELSHTGLQLGSPIFIRIFKVERCLEVWVQGDHAYHYFRSYPICDYSGYPGPKLHEGDWQSPEGFYSVTSEQMNPWSDYHLSFSIGYPNLYDQARQRSGSAIMVHGGCSSMGCFAMSDYRMEEIYTLTHAALTKGQQAVSLHIFPFKLTRHNIQKYKASPWLPFWQVLKKGYDAFERTHQVPNIAIIDGQYVVASGMNLAASQGSTK